VTTRFAIGDEVLWHQESRAGYGYVNHFKGKVTGIGAKRVRISVELAVGGTWKEVWVEAHRLRLPVEQCAIPICVMRRKATESTKEAR